MKNKNLLNWLWTDSHEKQSPQRFVRYAAMLIMLLTLGVGQMWGADTWTVAGSNAAIINGTSTWCTDCSANDLTNISGNYWALEITGKNPSGSSYNFKICKNHSWDEAYPDSDYVFNNIATGSGTTILYTFNSSTKAINAYGFKTWRVVGTEAATGSSWSTTDTKNNMSKGSNVYTYTLTKKNMALASGTTYEFKIIKDGAYTVSFPASNKTFTVATTGRYDITYSIDLSTQTVSVSATPSTYSITLNKNGGSSDGSVTATYNSTSLTSFSGVTRSYYDCSGYYTAKSGGSKIINAAGTLPSTTVAGYLSSGKWVGDTVTILFAQWTPKTYTITYKDEGGSSYSGSNSVSLPASYTYGTGIASLTDGVRSGYRFDGWFDNLSCTGSAVSSISSSANGNKTFYAKWTPNTYTVSFDVNGGTASTPDNKNVTFGAAYGELPGGMTHASKQFIGWYTDPDDGEGTHIIAETIVSTAENHTLYAHYENVYSVNVNFKCGSDVIYPSTSVNASPTSLTPEITAPEIFGYTFTGWTGSNATFGNASSATTTVNATAATTVTANYNVVPTVYFKNNLGWDSVFVSFDIAWIEKGGKQVPSNKTKPYYKMTQIGTTDIYYCEIPNTYTSSNYASWSANIAFDNTNYGRHATSDHIGTWDFYGGEFTGRGDFDPKTTLFIPYDGDTETRNNGTFYKTGCWMKYNSTESGYQVNMNTWVTGTHDDTLTVALNAANAGGYEFSAKLNLKHADYSYGFKLYKIYQKSANDIWYTNCPATITAATDDLPWHFWAGESITATSERCALHTEALGDYTITVSFATGRPEVNVIYPASVGDWRLAYNDRIAWSGDIHGAGWYLYSRVIKAKADAEDLVSFYVSKAVGASAHIELQKCTAINPSTGAETWTKQGDNLDLSSITGTGIYNFKVTQNGSKVATAAYDGAYDGNFYIRTDASDGGWNNYISSGKNLMTYSEYAEDNSGFTHYYMRYVTTGSNIKFCIANDYSECLTEYCVSDDFTNEYIEANGNVRFMWDHRTNAVSRAYISGSSVVSDRFLVLEGDEKLFNESGQALTTAGGGKVSGLNDNEMNFIDDQNWIYEATVKAQPKAKVKLTAKYNNQIQYFYGDEGDDAADSVLLLDGTGTDKYKMRIVYDFKTNRLLRAFIPDGEISAPMAINADMMIIREHQEQAQQISFSGDGALSDVKTVYGAMKFNKYTVNGKSKESGHASTGASRYERDLFYISFPFDVKLGDAFGFGEYGKHWIIEYYDGKGRAEKGFWADSEPNWKFVWPAQRSSFTMKAFEGYILALELDEMAESSSIWDNGVENVYVYFPSDGNVNNISATNRTITIDQEGYECKINRATPDGNRTVKDSYWHCIGVPSFANYSRPLSPTSGGETIDWSDADGDWSTPNLPYLYEWNRENNSLSVTTSATFDFKATWSYLVQYAGTSIYWSQVNVTPASIVARERTAPTNAEFRIELQQGGEKTDQTFVRLTEEENVTTGFDFNYDLSKEYNKNRANIYTMVTTVKEGVASETQSAANVLPMSDQTTVVPVGVKIATTGDYTFAIPEGTAGVGVTLIDNETGIRTSLSALDYTINLSAGTYENRFVLEISPIKQMPTDIESVSDQHSAVRKVMVDGILYIVKDGKVFDARGAKVK